MLFAAEKPAFDIVAIERPRILEKAAKYLKEEPVTVTATSSPTRAFWGACRSKCRPRTESQAWINEATIVAITAVAM